MYELDGYYSSYGSAPAQKPKFQLRKYPFLVLQQMIERNHAENSKFHPTEEAEIGSAPLLLNCFRAHMIAIHRIEFSDARSIILTATRPGYVRLWTLSGAYLGFLGSHGSFQNPLYRKLLKEKLPEDIRRVASTLTLHVS